MTPLWVRLWHWGIALLFVILVVTGVVLTYSRSDFALMDYALADTLHQVAGIIFSGFFGAFLVAAWRGSYWKSYRRRSDRLWSRIRIHAKNVIAGRSMPEVPDEPSPSRVELSRGLLFLIQQLLSILSIAVLSPLLAVTGLVLLYPELAPSNVGGLSGLWTLALTHYWVGLLSTLFLLFHVYIATIGGLRRMIRGR